MKNARAFAFNEASIGARMGKIGLVCSMPNPTDAISSARIATPMAVSAFMVLNIPDETIINPQLDHN